MIRGCILRNPLWL